MYELLKISFNLIERVINLKIIVLFKSNIFWTNFWILIIKRTNCICTCIIVYVQVVTERPIAFVMANFDSEISAYDFYLHVYTVDAFEMFHFLITWLKLKFSKSIFLLNKLCNMQFTCTLYIELQIQKWQKLKGIHLSSNHEAEVCTMTNSRIKC